MDIKKSLFVQVRNMFAGLIFLPIKAVRVW